MSEPLFVQQKNGMGILTLNRPQALNAINIELGSRIFVQLKQWEQDPAINAILLNSSSTRAFCAGGDIRQIADFVKQADLEMAFRLFKYHYELVHYVAHYHKPIISIMDGITMGGGIGLGAFTSYRVITERSVLAMPEIMIGLVPDAGSNLIFQAAPGYTGLRAMLTGQRLREHEIIALGFADYEISSDSVNGILSQLVEKPVTEDRLNKILFPFKKEYRVDPDYLAEVNAVYDTDGIDRIIANLKRCRSAWAEADLEILLHSCPFSLEIAYRSWHRKVANLKSALRQDLMLIQHLIRRLDFLEGVRAAVIDKDRSPEWDRSFISERELEACFTFI